MIEQVIVTAVLGVIAFLVARLCLWWYDARIGRKERLRGQQYRLFALRDRAFRLMADGKVQPEDGDWASLYEHLNESAKLASVRNMQSNLDFALALLIKGPPCAPGEFRVPAPELAKLWNDYRSTVVDICRRGIADKRAPSDEVKHRLKKQHKEREAENFDRWNPPAAETTASLSGVPSC